MGQNRTKEKILYVVPLDSKGEDCFVKLQFRFMCTRVCWMAVSRPSLPWVRKLEATARKEQLCGPGITQPPAAESRVPQRRAPARCGPGAPEPRSLRGESERARGGLTAVRPAAERKAAAERGGGEEASAHLLLYLPEKCGNSKQFSQ